MTEIAPLGEYEEDRHRALDHHYETSEGTPSTSGESIATNGFIYHKVRSCLLPVPVGAFQAFFRSCVAVPKEFGCVQRLFIVLQVTKLDTLAGLAIKYGVTVGLLLLL